MNPDLQAAPSAPVLSICSLLVIFFPPMLAAYLHYGPVSTMRTAAVAASIQVDSEGTVMTDEQDKQGRTRRDFIRDATLAGGGLAVSTVLPGVAMAAEAGADRAKPEQGYRLTEHVARYYESLKG